MAYRLMVFDGLPIPPWLRSGDEQNIGSGAALTSFLQLPGGGYYDNYQAYKSPQGIRPISKSGLFRGTDDELEAQINAWRAKLGVRGKLVIEWDNGEVRWQWARLQNLSTPRPSQAKSRWLPVTFTWVTAAQNWRGYVLNDEWWVWGDTKWTFGDGSTGFGVYAPTFAIPGSAATATLTYGGDIEAAGVQLSFALAGTWQNVTIVNRTSGQTLTVNQAAACTAPLLEINSGARSLYRGEAAVAIAGLYRRYNVVYVTTGSPHLLTSGMSVRISKAPLYNGDYYPVTVTDANTFTVPISARNSQYGDSSGGTAQGLTNLYATANISDRPRWLVLVPGINQLTVSFSPQPSSAQMTVSYVDHYA